MLLLIDNYDSFTWNLAQYFGELGVDVQVLRNDAIDVHGIDAMRPDRIVVSPGPGTPEDSGVSLTLLRAIAAGDALIGIPVLGVCLGHQAIGHAFGARVVRAQRVMHGKTSRIRHVGDSVFSGLPDGYSATRYHSLVVAQEGLPDCLEVTAWTENPDGTREAIMGLRHKSLPVHGVQFHPESIATQHGHALLRNFMALRGRV